MGMLPLNKARLADNINARFRRDDQHAFEAKIAAEAAANPYEPCKHCFGQGRYATDANGKRRPFDHRDFSLEKGDRYEASCPKCRGFKRIPCTPARAVYLAKRALRLQRKEYRKIRSAVMEAVEIGADHFDRLAKKRLLGEPTPAKWIAAARAVAESFTVEIDHAA